MAPTENGTVATSTQTPYKLDPEQTLRASKALLQHIKKETQHIQNSTAKKELLKSEDSDSEEDKPGSETPIWLNLTTKQHIVDQNCLRPSKIRVPNSLNTAENLSICIITADPQRAVKNIVADPTFPTELSSRIERVIGLVKLRARYKTFEQRRELLSQHDVFLADDRIITRLPGALGKVFYKGTSKRPIPVSIAELQRDAKGKKLKKAKASMGNKKAQAERTALFCSPEIVAKEIYRALDSVPVSLKQGTNAATRIGLASFQPEQLTENIEVVVNHIMDKHVVKGWRNVKAIHIKSPTSMAMPIWLADELWTENGNVEEAQQLEAIEGAPTSLKRKRNPNTIKGPQAGQRKKAKTDDEDGDESDGEKENAKADLARKEKLKKQKAKAFKSEIVV